jgi:hypothetical protein
MRRTAWLVGSPLVLLAALTLRADDAAEDVEASVRALRDLGATFGRKSDAPGAPVISACLLIEEANDDTLALLKPFRSLQTLHLPKQITDKGLAHLAGLTRLEFLDLHGSRVTDKGVVVGHSRIDA